MTAGNCSVCNSDDTEYGSMEVVDDCCSYEIICNHCGATGHEWYDLIYTETIMRNEEK